MAAQRRTLNTDLARSVGVMQWVRGDPQLRSIYSLRDSARRGSAVATIMHHNSPSGSEPFAGQQGVS